jgi:hypothetical protein
MRYTLVIMTPNGEEKRFESMQPFMQISIGDTFNMMLFQDAEGLNLPLQAVGVEHMIWQDNVSINQMVVIYTKRVGLE